jgi:hypothetical protein
MSEKPTGKTPSEEPVPGKKMTKGGSRKSGPKTSRDRNTGSSKTGSIAGRKTGRRGDAVDDDTPVPIDDAVDFDLIRRQQRLKEKTHTRLQMEKVWAQIQADLQEYRNKMRFE